MRSQETPRQKKINTIIQHEIAYLLQDAIRKSTVTNLVVSVTKVKVVPDISMAKVYISIFPNKKVDLYLKNLKKSKNQLRHDLSQKMKGQLRKIPELNGKCKLCSKKIFIIKDYNNFFYLYFYFKRRVN